MELNYNLLSGKIAIITGANRGIGKSMVELFASNGAIVYAIARKKDSLQDVASGNIIPCYLDVTNNDAVKELFATIKKNHNHLDILVNNAGVMLDALLGMITQEQLYNTYETNVFANIQMIKYAAKFMTRQKSGSIINIASIMGITGNAGQVVYSSSKGAVLTMTKSVAKELAPYNIRVNAIAPGVINTDLLNATSEEKIEKIKAKIHMGYIGEPIEVAKTALFLASDLSTYVSGQIIGVDGMMSN